MGCILSKNTVPLIQFCMMNELHEVVVAIHQFIHNCLKMLPRFFDFFSQVSYVIWRANCFTVRYIFCLLIPITPIGQS